MTARGAYRLLPIIFAIAWLPSSAGAQQKRATQVKGVDFGKMEYEAKCASCHGLKGKGDGAASRYMTQKVPDLSTLARTNGGILPFERMYDVITGAKGTSGPHGSREMPVWGPAYRVEAVENYAAFVDIPYDPESYVRGRVLTLIEYVNRLQVK